ncbi:helix-hairpin-helix domain-containing protein [Virgibacillus kimchii]
MNELLKKSLFVVAAIIAIGLFLLFTRGDDGAELYKVEHLQNDEVLSEADAEMKVDDSLSEMQVMVDVKGQVKNPDVYEVPADSRVNDVILKAGGFTEDADETQVNLAQKVQDEMIIMIPSTGENEETAKVLNGAVHKGKVRINFADPAEIETLSGIGPAKAEAIIQYREDNGPFQTAEDLLNISGIGKKTLENMIDNIIIP